MVWRQLPFLALAGVLAIPPVRFALTPDAPGPDWSSAAWAHRAALIERAKVFVPTPPDPSTVDFASVTDEVRCTFVPKAAGATTPKFDCRLANGDVVKVKYGRTRERQGEVAATRLLRALGFGADHVTMAARVHCAGCPRWPFQTRIIAEQFLLAGPFERALDYDQKQIFEWASVEHKIDGREIEVGGVEGWDWSELTSVKSSAGGASSDEVDALRLVAVLLAHWDNKPSNQRLVCLGDEDDGRDPSGPCRWPLLMLQDLGSTFGPGKVSYDTWAPQRIWADASSCAVSMEHLPYDGASFTPTTISEGGRLLLAERLQRISETQLHALFAAARFPDPVTGDMPAADVSPWVRALQRKVREIADRPPCPLRP